MQMQTGPGPDQPMRTWLAWTGGIEIINIAIFGIVLWRLERAMPGLVGPLSLIGFGTLSVLLLEGGLYWLVKRARPLPHVSSAWQLRLLQFLYVANGIVMLIFPLALLSTLVRGVPPLAIGDALIGSGWYLFGLGEFIHYFFWKINMRGSERQRQRTSARRIPARFRRELVRAQRAATLVDNRRS